jgi:excisionase family DNA binding protein
MEKLYTMETLAEYLGVSIRTILREKAAGKINFKRIRGQVRFSQEDINNYLSNNSFESEGLSAESPVTKQSRP